VEDGKKAANLRKGDKVTFVGVIDLVSDPGDVMLYPYRLESVR
jgi:hypothetical protein